MKNNKRNTKARIVSAAWRLFYEQGYENTTIEEIIDESETSKGSFYTILREKTHCWVLLPTFSTKSIRSLKKERK